MKASLLVVLRQCSLPLLLLLVVAIILPCLALQRDSGNVMTWGRRELESTVSEGTRVNGSDFVVAAGLQQQQHLPKQVVRITQTLTLELPEDDTNQVVTDGDVESFLCPMSTMYTHLLLLGSQPPDQELDKQGQGQVQVQVQLDNATWSFTQAQATVQVDVTVPGIPPELLLTNLQNVSISDMNNWLRNHVRRQESFPWKTIAVMAWDGEIVVSLPHDIATTTTNDGNYYFSTAFCGVARVSLEFAFFNDLVLNTTAANNTDYQAHVNNLLCSSSEYFAGLFTQLWTLVHGQSSPQQRQRQQDLVLVTLDRINSGIIPLHNDDNAESPLDVTITLELDARAYVASSHRRIPAVLLLQWLQQSDWQEYIQQAVWESVPYSSNLFFHTNSVKFHGNVRDYYNYYLEESIPSATTSASISTDHCVDGVMMLPDSTDGTATMAAPQKVQKLSPVLTTNWILHFGFQDHVGAAAVSPTAQDMKALFCQTFSQFKNMFPTQPPVQQEAAENPTSRSINNKNAEAPFSWRQNYTNLTMQAYDWSFDAAANYPISLAVIVQAYTEIPSSSPRRVDPLLLWDKILERFDIQTFFSDYVWKDNPIDSYFYFSNRIRYEGGVIPQAQVESATTITYKSQDCFRASQASTLYPTGVQVPATAVDGALANEVDGNVGQVSRDPTKVTAVDIDTSAIVIHLPNIPVNDGSDDLTQSLADMFTAMIASKPRRGIKRDAIFHNGTEAYISRPLPPKETGPQPSRAIPPPEDESQQSESLPSNDNEQLPLALAQGTNVSQPSRLPDDEGEPQPSRPLPPKLPPTRHRNLQVNIDLKSITLGEISSISDCSEFFGQAKGSLDNKACSKVPIHFEVEVVDEDPEEVKQEFVVMAQVGIETGRLQEKLDQRNPDSGLTLVPDPAETAAIAVEAAAIKPPESPPSEVGEETTSAFDENEQKSIVPSDSIMEVIPQNATATTAEGETGPSSVTTIIIVLLSVIIGIYAIINVYGLNKLRRHETRSDAQESGLLSRQLREAKYHDVI